MTTPYGGIGSANLLGLGIDELMARLGGPADGSGRDFFEYASDEAKAQYQRRQIELTALAQDIANCFSGPSGEAVLKWMIDKTLLNPALPFDYGKSFEELAVWRAMREGENAFVFQIITAINQHRTSNGAST